MQVVIILFAQNLKTLRKAHGLTQIAFAQQFHIANGTIAMWETGKREPDFATTMRIADFFGVSVDYLLGRDEKEKATPSQDEAASLLQEPLMKDIYDAALQLSPEHRKLVLAQIEAVKALEDSAKK